MAMATRRPDDKVADKLAAIASDMVSRNDGYEPLPEGELERRIRITVILCVAAIVVSFAIAAVVWLAD
jgi:hypothetical protein